MKKKIKRVSHMDHAQVAPDMSAIIQRVEQQLATLERKIDTLLTRSQARPFEGRQQAQSLPRFERPVHQGQRGQGYIQKARTFTKAICADCHKECEVPFKPSGDRPVYCQECFSRRKQSGSFQVRHVHKPAGESSVQASSFDKPQGKRPRRSGQRTKSALKKRR